MAENARLYTYDNDGETLREREVEFWFTRDNGEDETEDGMYIHIGEHADEVNTGITITAAALQKIGYYRALDLLDEETLLGLGYVKVFAD